MVKLLAHYRSLQTRIGELEAQLVTSTQTIAEFRSAFNESAGGSAAVVALQERCAELVAANRINEERLETLVAQLGASQAAAAAAQAAAEASAAEASHATQRYGTAIDRLSSANAEVARLVEEAAGTTEVRAELVQAREAQAMAEAARGLMAGMFVEKEAVITELRNAVEALEAQVRKNSPRV